MGILGRNRMPDVWGRTAVTWPLRQDRMEGERTAGGRMSRPPEAVPGLRRRKFLPLTDDRAVICESP